MIKHVITLFFLLFSVCSFAQTGTAWPNYRGNNVLNGISHSTFNTPIKLLWSFKTGDEIKSSPVISNNLIFIGSMDGQVYALNLAGKVKWKFKAESSVESSPIVIKKTVIIS
ncbi:MAG TPA: PQQ-binding-like beta-propeller repeat protein, partial [Paludibacter sp.]|nr:PQQ-binding-like beta-propeller repeat protein [Paludibacter sp.]